MRGEETVTLLTEALERDMRGGQNSVLRVDQPALEASTLYDLADDFAQAFAKFPYVDSFFVWRRSEEGGSVYFFNRSERRPAWDSSENLDDPFPVAIRRDPPAMDRVLAEARNTSSRTSRFATDFKVSGRDYQTFSELFYQGPAGEAEMSAMVGFTIDLDWTKRHYFGDFIEQMQEIIGDDSLGISIADENGSPIAAVGPPTDRSAHVRRIPLLFMDRSLVTQGNLPQVREWTVQVGVTNEAALSAASVGTSLTLALLGLAALVTLVALAMMVRATAAAAELAAVQSEFVSSVSHEMKTPLSLIRLASDALATGQYASQEKITEYGRLLTTEAAQLTRLIDNVLSYARPARAKREYTLEPVDISELIQECINRFRLELDALGFGVETHLPIESSEVNVDRALMQQAFDNLINNALRHAGEGGKLTVNVVPTTTSVRVEFADAGPGIPPDELPHVFEKFYRGSGAKHHGSGLGLAIVQRIVTEHGGQIFVDSILEQGTCITVDLPRRPD